MNTIASFRKCTLSNEQLLEKVDKLTDEIFINQQVPTRHIPAEPDSDYDLLVGELILRFKEMSNALQKGAYESFWTDTLVLEFAVRSHLGENKELTIQEFKKQKGVK